MNLVGFKARNHPQQKVKPHVDDRQTSPELFARLTARFNFTLDVAASDRNAQCSSYFTPERNGLGQPWTGRVWCNPPYSNIEPWVEKAWHEYHCGVELIVMLLPANRTEQGWWQRQIEPYRDLVRVEFLAGRQRFIAHDAIEVGKNERPPFGVCLAIWSNDRGS
jgi:phage N-6-adenine-methyltransferase